MGQPAQAGNRRWARPLAALAALLLTAVLAAACGDDSSDAGTAARGDTVQWTLVLDYEPNAVHAGLLRAQQAGYFRDAGIELEIIAPSSTADALTQVTRGRAELGLGDLIDVARRNERAVERVAAQDKKLENLQTVAAFAGIVQEPLSGILVDADGPVRMPADLTGKTVAVSGVPSDEAVVAAIAGDANPKTVTLGFNGLKALDAGRVDATTAYWPADEVTLQALGTTPRRFTLAEQAGLRYPGLVAFASRRVQVTQPGRLRGFREALRRGTLDVIADQAKGLEAVRELYPELDVDTTRAQLERYAPLFGDERTATTLAAGPLRAFAAFAQRSGLTKRALGVAELTGATAADGKR